MHTDGGGEGYSIPAQREACYRKAEALGAQVVDEYVDAGESARKSSRPALQAMLGRLRSLADVDFVIVHKVDRLARNRADDATITLEIVEAGARLVSCSENIDETPAGSLLHGIMSSMAEYFSKNLATEVRKGMDQKAKKGGLPTRAPIGYRNARELVDGDEVRTVVVEDQRADHVVWAFETYAAGEHSLRRLTQDLEGRGLVSIPTKRTPSQALKLASVHRMLKNPFYAGWVDYKGERYQGRHDALVPIDLWDKVQELLDSRNLSGERRREHPHYLKGTIYCRRCQRRLCFSRSRGKTGVYYDYFFCLGRQSGNGCDLPSLPVAQIEDEIARLHDRIALTNEGANDLRSKLESGMRKLISHRERESAQQRKRADRLETERRRLLRAHLDGAVPVDLLREEQARIERELSDAHRLIAEYAAEWTTIEANLTQVLGMLADEGAAYRAAGPEARPRVNQSIFLAVYLDADEEVPYTRLAGAFDYIVEKAPPEPPEVLHGCVPRALGRFRVRLIWCPWWDSNPRSSD